MSASVYGRSVDVLEMRNIRICLLTHSLNPPDIYTAVQITDYLCIKDVERLFSKVPYQVHKNGFNTTLLPIFCYMPKM